MKTSWSAYFGRRLCLLCALASTAALAQPRATDGEITPESALEPASSQRPAAREPEPVGSADADASAGSAAGTDGGAEASADAVQEADGGGPGADSRPAADGSAAAAAERAAARAGRVKTWRQRYDEARTALVEGRDEEAAREFQALAVAAPTYEDRIVAEELGEVARSRSVKQRLELTSPDLRAADEMSLLYTTAFLYGFGTSGWLALQTKPQNVGAAVLPFIAITTATVGGVALVDDYRPFRYGVPQTISAGVYLGAGQGVWLVGYQHARATRKEDASHFKSETVATILWAGATGGAVVGGLLGAWKNPTPGEVSFGTSTMLWGGLLSAFAGAALTPDEDRSSENAFVTGAVGYNVGLVTGVLLGPELSPSVGRVRFVDLGGLAGGLVGVGGYLLAVGDGAEPRAGLASATIGSALGLGLAWWATSDMDLKPPSESDESTALVPHFAPVPGGVVAGVSGSL